MHKSVNLSVYTLLPLLLLHTLLLAQRSNNLDYLALNSGDTLFGKVTHIDDSRANRGFFKKVRLVDAYGKTTKVRRKDIAAFSVNNTTYKSFWLNQTTGQIRLINPRYDIDPKDGKQHYLKVLDTGTLNHYELEWFEQGNATLMSMSLVRKEDDSFFIRADQGLLGLKRNVLMNYFSDCPKIRKKIKLKQLKKVSQVVAYYNTHCIK